MKRTRRALLASLMVALTIAAGFALAGIPNVELVSTLIFIAGFLLGPKLGAVAGAFSFGVHSALNPLGAAVPTVLAAQIVSGALIGVAGSIAGPIWVGFKRPWFAAVMLGITGGILTLAYQILVNVASFYAFVSGEADAHLWKYLVAGLAFTSLHLVWNTGVFLVILRPVLSVLNRYRLELK